LKVIGNLECRIKFYSKKKPRHFFYTIEYPYPPTNSVCSLAGRYDNPIPPRFLAPIDFYKIPALAHDIPIPTRFLALLDYLKIPALKRSCKTDVVLVLPNSRGMPGLCGVYYLLVFILK
jgi:hypothetical protein